MGGFLTKKRYALLGNAVVRRAFALLARDAASGSRGGRGRHAPRLVQGERARLPPGGGAGGPARDRFCESGRFRGGSLACGPRRAVRFGPCQI